MSNTYPEDRPQRLEVDILRKIDGRCGHDASTKEFANGPEFIV